LEFSPFWLATFSASVIRPRQAVFGVRKLTGSCAPLIATSAPTTSNYLSNFGTADDPNSETHGKLSDQLKVFAGVSGRETLALTTTANLFEFKQTGPKAGVYERTTIGVFDNWQMLAAIIISLVLSAVVALFGCVIDYSFLPFFSLILCLFSFWFFCLP
jgi:hypothetical protein